MEFVRTQETGKIVDEYLGLCCGKYSQEGFLNYLKLLGRQFINVIHGQAGL